VELLQLSVWKPAGRPGSPLAADRDDVAPESLGSTHGNIGKRRSDLDRDVHRRTPPGRQESLGAPGGVPRLIIHEASPIALDAAATVRHRRVDDREQHAQLGTGLLAEINGPT
jgi:hypothetical protein